MNKRTPYIVAEIASAHEGNFDLACELVEVAAVAGVDAVKFQVFDTDQLVSKDHKEYQYFKDLEYDQQTWGKIIEKARTDKLEVYFDIFDLESAQQLSQFQPDGYKIHISDTSNINLLKSIAGWGKPILLSVGGSLWTETAEAIEVLKLNGCQEITLVYGIQNNPTSLDESHLRKIFAYKEKFELPVGYSPHLDGGTKEAIQVPIWSVAAGAEYLEIHITKNRSLKGPDYYSALDPEPFTDLVKEIRKMASCLGYTSLKLSKAEQKYRLKYKKWPVLAYDLPAGHVITSKDIKYQRLENGQPKGSLLRFSDETKYILTNPLKKGTAITMNDIKLKVAAVLACRAESSRLYAKPMQNIGSKPILSHIVERFRQVQMIDEIVLAISEGPAKGVFMAYAEEHSLPFVIGSEKDVLARVIQGAELVNADVVIRHTTENPFIHYEVLSDQIRRHIENSSDLTVVTNMPIGTFSEICSLSALKKSHKFGEERHRSELVTLYINEHPEIFNNDYIEPPQHLRRPEYRLTIDTAWDLVLALNIWENLGNEESILSVEEILRYLDENKELAKINLKGENTLHLYK
ncbi:MAG: hypothetical protein DHS20C09_20410 [marine bacterium B5-7]|nr:MAG: hypothetical protein DHS20C09_20410 [marine bacterium B5-7]